MILGSSGGVAASVGKVEVAPCSCCRAVATLDWYELWGMLCSRCARAVGADS